MLVNEQWIIFCHSVLQRISSKCYPIPRIEQLRSQLQGSKGHTDNSQTNPISNLAHTDGESVPARTEGEGKGNASPETVVDADLQDVMEELQEDEQLSDDFSFYPTPSAPPKVEFRGDRDNLRKQERIEFGRRVLVMCRESEEEYRKRRKRMFME